MSGECDLGEYAYCRIHDRSVTECFKADRDAEEAARAFRDRVDRLARSYEADGKVDLASARVARRIREALQP